MIIEISEKQAGWLEEGLNLLLNQDGKTYTLSEQQITEIERLIDLIEGEELSEIEQEILDSIKDET